MDIPTAPECFVIDCNNLSALSDVSTGALWSFTAHYCSDCYTALLNGVRLDIDTSRLELKLAGDSCASAPIATVLQNDSALSLSSP